MREKETWEAYRDAPGDFYTPGHQMGSVMAPGVSDWRTNSEDPASERQLDGFLYRNSFFWGMAQYLWLMMREAPARPALDAYVRAIGLSRNCLAVHVRHGDSCFDKSLMNAHRTCRPWSEYLAAIHELDAAYGPFEHIYVASDDESVATDARATLPPSQLKMQDIDRSFFDLANGATVDDSQKFDDLHAISSIANDIWAMASCEAYVGTQSSAVSWITSGLLVAQRGHYVPMISLDDSFNEPAAAGRFL